MNTTHTIEVIPTGDRFTAIVKELGATVTGATEEEALTEAQRAIVASLIEAEKRKRRKRGKGHTVA
jgi:hypothetical protein